MNTDNTQDGAEPSLASAGSRGDAVCDRIAAYLFSGGLFSPEMANHDAVRDLLIDARDEIKRLRVNLRLADAGFMLGHPTLTDEERAALEYGIRQADEYDRVGIEDAKRAAIVFRGLLKRLG